MSPELILELRRRYPTAFRFFEINGMNDIGQIALWGLSSGDGWLPVLEPLLAYVELENCRRTPENYILIRQIKSKFGGLRFYVQNAPAELRMMISQAERTADAWCEDCGVNVGDVVRADFGEPELVAGKCAGVCDFLKRYPLGSFAARAASRRDKSQRDE